MKKKLYKKSGIPDWLWRNFNPYKVFSTNSIK